MIKENYKQLPQLKTNIKLKPSRLWEIDTVRGIAVILMVFYHFVWDLSFFGLYRANMMVGGWPIFARSIATTFIFVMGLSLTFSYAISQQKNISVSFNKYLWRGGQIFGLGLLITVGTYFFIGRGFVIFGILHLLGLSIILAYPFLFLNRWITLLAGLFSIGIGLYLNEQIVPFPWLIWLGVLQSGRYMVDYYPLLPWFGVVLIGIFAGYSLYPQGKARFILPDWGASPVIGGLRFLGLHSLLIYLVHQPIFMGIFTLLGYGSF